MALSVMMAECCALSTAMREVLPLRVLVKAIAHGMGIDSTCSTTFQTAVWEDNAGALALANLDPGQNTSRSKHFDSKAHWFRSHLKPNEIEVKKVDTKEQKADLFAKPSLHEPFSHLRKLPIGWQSAREVTSMDETHTSVTPH